MVLNSLVRGISWYWLIVARSIDVINISISILEFLIQFRTNGSTEFALEAHRAGALKSRVVLVAIEGMLIHKIVEVFGITRRGCIITLFGMCTTISYHDTLQFDNFFF